MSINPSLHAKLSYDPFKDFAPISMLVINPQILVAHPALAASNVRELVALAKSKPGQLNFASSGTGIATHLGLELFKAATGINVVHVPYKGGAPALTDLIAGQVQLLFISIPSVMPQVKAGRLKALAVSSARRSLSAPEVPTVAESGYPGFEYVNWNALFAPAATPRAIISKLEYRGGKDNTRSRSRSKTRQSGCRACAWNAGTARAIHARRFRSLAKGHSRGRNHGQLGTLIDTKSQCRPLPMSFNRLHR